MCVDEDGARLSAVEHEFVPLSTMSSSHHSLSTARVHNDVTRCGTSITQSASEIQVNNTHINEDNLDETEFSNGNRINESLDRDTEVKHV